MTKTEAAEIIANQAIVFARRTGQPVTRTAIEEHLSEGRVHAAGSPRGDAAALANWRTVATIVRREARSNGESHLVSL